MEKKEIAWSWFYNVTDLNNFLSIYPEVRDRIISISGTNCGEGLNLFYWRFEL